MKIYKYKVTKVCVGETETDYSPVCTPHDIVPYMKGAFKDFPDQEQFFVITLDGQNKPKGRHLVTVGILNQTQIHAREVFKVAILDSAAGIILCHNHPSGNKSPSVEDVAVTRKLIEIGRLHDIPVLDHVIFTEDNGFTSIRTTHGRIFETEV